MFFSHSNVPWSIQVKCLPTAINSTTTILRCYSHRTATPAVFVSRAFRNKHPHPCSPACPWMYRWTWPCMGIIPAEAIQQLRYNIRRFVTECTSIKHNSLTLLRILLLWISVHQIFIRKHIIIPASLLNWAIILKTFNYLYTIFY